MSKPIRVDSVNPNEDDEAAAILAVMREFQETIHGVQIHIAAAACISMLHNIGLQMPEHGTEGMKVLDGIITTCRKMLDTLEADTSGGVTPASGVH